MSTKASPGSYDCYTNAADDEPMFVLLARDARAPQAVTHWADNFRAAKRALGLWDMRAQNKYAEAMRCAEQMKEWREKRDASSR
ncbi:MAG: hypothetical protein ABIP06_06475 [Pyrinomonadaceae bacterium]